MLDKKQELREWVREKKHNQMFALMCYASVSFKLQREGIHNLCSKLNKADTNLYQKLNPAKDIVCGWADDLMRLIGMCYPDFKEKFSTGITIKDAEGIICSELRIFNI